MRQHIEMKPDVENLHLDEVSKHTCVVKNDDAVRTAARLRKVTRPGT